MHFRRMWYWPFLCSLILVSCEGSPTNPHLAPAAPQHVYNGSPLSEAAFLQDWPFAAALVVHHPTHGIWGWFCSASVIGARWVVTAAHCIDAISQYGDPLTVSVAVGSPNLYDPDLRLIAIQSTSRHPGWNRLDFTNDIGLIQLAADAGVTAAQLPSADVAVNSIIEAGGWGLTGFSPVPDGLFRRTSLTVVSDESTEKRFYARGTNTSVCSGDSGGPAVDASGILVGIHFFVEGIGCGSYQHSAHTSVYDFLPWILSNAEVGGDSEPPVVLNVAADPVRISSIGTISALLDDRDAGGSAIASAAFLTPGATTPVAMTALDGVFDETVEEVIGSFLVSNTAGLYEICVGGSDAAMNGATPACVDVAVYDPSAGFVTGGGWIASARGAFLPDPLATGKASFGFVAKYQKGARIPDGNTAFSFQAAALKFHSTSYDWLVINQNDSNAQFKGVGTIEGMPGEYRFMLWAGDHDSADTFRIRIWSVADESDVVYDNGPHQAIGGGNIIVHGGK